MPLQGAPNSIEPETQGDALGYRTTALSAPEAGLDEGCYALPEVAVSQMLVEIG